MKNLLISKTCFVNNGDPACLLLPWLSQQDCLDIFLTVRLRLWKPFPKIISNPIALSSSKTHVPFMIYLWKFCLGRNYMQWMHIYLSLTMNIATTSSLFWPDHSFQATLQKSCPTQSISSLEEAARLALCLQSTLCRHSAVETALKINGWKLQWFHRLTLLNRNYIVK